jgi:HK97 family phage major capsid protein
VYDAQRPVQLLDLLPSRPISSDAIKYMEETTFTNNAAEVAEGNTYGEAALALTERTQVVEKVGVWLPVTDEQLEDVVGIQGYLDNRLPFMLRQRIDYQIMQGTGVTPLLQGVINKTSVQTHAKGADVTPDAIYKGMVHVRTTGWATPTAVVLHPNDWQDIRLLRTADGIYIWGSPSDAGPARIWGVPVVECSSCTEGTGVIGDFRMFSEIAYKRGIQVKVTDSHSTYFIEGKQAIRADVRCVIVWYRPEAFCLVTGI